MASLSMPTVSFTEDEQKSITEFRERIVDVLHPEHDDLDLLKWLQARKFDLGKTEAMYRESMKWRKEVSADTILEDFTIPDVLKQYFPSVVTAIGNDKEGHPLFVSPTGGVDIYGITSAATKEEITRTIIQNLEQTRKHLRSRSQETGVRVHQVVQILDMQGFGMQHLSLTGMQHLSVTAANLYTSILNMLQDNYPNMMQRTYIIHVPKLFYAVYKVLSSTVMDEETTKKFVILEGSGKDRLLQDIDPSQLPEFYGGTMTDPDGDPKCKSKICYGGKVPQELYLKNQKKSQATT